MKSLQERFGLAIKHLRMDSTWLVGVSGGRDSMVLLHLLQSAGFKKLIVCHLNHGIRRTGQRDQKFVEKAAALSHLQVIYDILEKMPKTDSLESTLRTRRLEFFAKTASDTGAAGVFLGHHADDLAETFLWNLLRGSGTAGLGGIQPETDLTTACGPIRLLRPLLDIWRSEIDTYLSEHHLAFVEDETNRSRRFTRNRVRHDIVPWLETKLGRNIRQNLHRTASILSEENLVLESLLPDTDWDAPLSVAALLPHPVALQRRIILKWLQHHAIAEAGFEEVENIRTLLDVKTGPARINLAQNRQARRRAGKITLARQSD